MLGRWEAQKLGSLSKNLVFVKVSPLKKIVRFGKKGKLAPRFVGPFPITERISKLAYRVVEPSQLGDVGVISFCALCMLQLWLC